MMHKRILLMMTVFTSSFSYGEEAFSMKAWNEIESIYERIINHPFNKELEKGILDKRKFDFYKNQDAYYLKKFSKVLAILASKLDRVEDIKMILKFSSDSFDENLSEKEVDLRTISPSNFSYTEFLLSTSSWGSKGELAAALLPCYWIYLEVGIAMKKESEKNNPFFSWIKMYSSKSYESSVESMKKLTNRLYQEASEEERKRMLLMFKIASQLELGFWDDSYHMRGLFSD